MSEVTFKGFGGVTLSADLLGDPEKPPVLLLHGGSQTREDWADAAAALELAGRHVINLDLRGHGRSEWPADGRYDFDAFADDLKAVLAQMSVRPVIVAASLGAWIAAVVLAEEGAHLASGLVLVDGPPQVDPEAARKIGDAMRRRAQEDPARCKFDVRYLDGFDTAGVAARMTDGAPRLALPVLFVRGAESRLADHAVAERYVSAIPHSEFAEVEGAGHLVAAERADQFNAILLDFLERRVPLAPPEYHEGCDARTLRDALGCFATGVTIVTAHTPEGVPVGLTANSFTSVSLDPPLLLVCVAKTAGSAAVLENAERFAVNVLQIGQQPTSNRFAGKGEDRFAATPWDVGHFGTPVLTGSLGSFECDRHAVHDGGDHFILVGRVLKAIYEPRRDPLLYFRGKYRRLHFA